MDKQSYTNRQIGRQTDKLVDLGMKKTDRQMDGKTIKHILFTEGQIEFTYRSIDRPKD
jgi:hypothetical protein